MVDEPTAAPTRPTREQVREAITRPLQLGNTSQAGEDEAATNRVMALLAGEGTAQPEPSDGRWVVVNGGALAWRDRRTDRRWMLDPDEIGDQLWTAAPPATLTAAFTALVGLVRASRASGEGTAPQVPALWEGPLERLVWQLDYGDIAPLLEAVRERFPELVVRVVAADGAPQEGDER